ncbi:hypothetical protein JVU11DRAFT_1479 [Chiua virens]|nr:hypothetical protein JVU11DRAFT_1479 [Chiua virens]
MEPSHSTSLHCQYQPSRPSRQQSLRARQTPHRKRLSILSITSVFTRSAMPSRFNIVRAILYAVILAWSIICLAIAAHFQSLLIITDLTRFVPFAIFVCTASLLVLLVLLICSALRDRNPISTRIELGCLGLLGTFWLALGAFLASSDSENADVECYSSVDGSEVVNVAGFSTETYQAQYRVLEAFSLFNVILVWGFLLFLLGMALKHYYRVNRNVWYVPATIYPWFGPRSKMSKLPAPISTLFVFCLSGIVLGLAANFAQFFLPNINHDFTIFSLVAPSTTIFVFLLLLQFAQPIVEVPIHFCLGVLWLTMAAWSADIIGYVQCYSLAGQEQPTKNGSMSAQTYCYEMKVIEALSWCMFVMFVIFFLIVITLTTRAVALGRVYAWREHISQLGWFGEWPAYPTEAVYPRPPYANPQPYGVPYPTGGNYVQQVPGHSVVIQPGVNGAPPVITQVPGMVSPI